MQSCDGVGGASQVSVALLPVWVVAGIATLFLMMKSTTACTENCKHTSRGHREHPKTDQKVNSIPACFYQPSQS